MSCKGSWVGKLPQTPMQAARHAHSVSYWMDKLKDKDAAWLKNQFLYDVAHFNGPNYYNAVRLSLKGKGV